MSQSLSQALNSMTSLTPMISCLITLQSPTLIPSNSILSLSVDTSLDSLFLASSYLNTSSLFRCAKSLQSCPVLCNPMDCSPPGSSGHGFSRQEYWSRLSFPPPGHLPDLRDRTCVSYVSCNGRQVLYHQHYLRSPLLSDDLH